MSLFNLARFRFEKKTKTGEANVPPSLPQVQEIASVSASTLKDVDETTTLPSPTSDNAANIAKEVDDVTDHSSRPGTPASDVSEKTGELYQIDSWLESLKTSKCGLSLC